MPAFPHRSQWAQQTPELWGHGVQRMRTLQGTFESQQAHIKWKMFQNTYVKGPL